VLNPADSEKRCDLLLALGEAMLPADEARRVSETVAPEAFALAERNRDSARAARAAIQALDAAFGAGPAESYGSERSAYQQGEEHAWCVAEWAARADRHAADGSAKRVYEASATW
jgi:hypothetical protein